jgi:hypothetical protein
MGCLSNLFVNADKIYEYNLKLKNKNPFLFKIIGMNKKYLKNKNAWVNHQRIYIGIVALLLLSVMVPIVLFI